MDEASRGESGGRAGNKSRRLTGTTEACVCVYAVASNARLRFVPVQVAGKTKPGAALLVSGEEGSSDNECR